MNKLLIVHHNDVDGVVSKLVLLPKLANDYEDHTVETHCVNYGYDFSFLSELDSTDLVYFADFCLDPKFMVELSKLVKKLVVIDHHPVAKELSTLQSSNLEVVYNEYASGCELCWTYCYLDPIPRIIERLGSYDTFRFKEDHSKLYRNAVVATQEYVSANLDELGCLRDLLGLNETDVITVGSGMIKAKKSLVKIAIESGKSASIDGHDFLVYPGGVGFNAAAYDFDLYPMYHGYIFYELGVDGNVKCSIRSLIPDLDISEIAKKYGGGGHKMASGFRISYDEFMKLLNPPE